MAQNLSPGRKHLNAKSNAQILRPPPRAPSPPYPAARLDQELRPLGGLQAQSAKMNPPSRGQPVLQQQQRAVAPLTVLPLPPTALQHLPAPSVLERLPPGLWGRRGVGISDIRNDFMTEADARQALSSFVIFRMQKLHCTNEVDEEGYPLKPTWQRIMLAEETTLSQQEANRKVNVLNKETEAVGVKKSGLGFNVQCQIEKIHQNLQQRESDPRYEYILAQLESTTKRIGKNSPLVLVKTSKTSKGANTTKTLSVKPKKLGRERISVTVYFKRIPKPSECAIAMLVDTERRRKQTLALPAPPPPAPAPIQQQHLALPMQAQPSRPTPPATAHPIPKPIQRQHQQRPRHSGTGATKGSSRDSRSTSTSDVSWDSESSRTTSSDNRDEHRHSRNRDAGPSREQSQKRCRGHTELSDLIRRRSREDEGVASTSGRPQSLNNDKKWVPPSTLDSNSTGDHGDFTPRGQGIRSGYLDPRPPPTRRLPFNHVSDDEGRRHIFDDRMNRISEQLHRNRIVDSGAGLDFKRRLNSRGSSPHRAYDDRDAARHRGDDAQNPFELFKEKASSYASNYRR